MMAKEGVIVQITHCFILKYKKIVTLVFFKCNISVKARNRKMDISIEWPISNKKKKHTKILQINHYWEKMQLLQILC